MGELLDLLSCERREPVWPLFVHAHPDDETLQTGALIAWLTTRHVISDVVVCTLGERGEKAAGVVPSNITTADYVRIRKRELKDACGVLGIGHRFILGTSPARSQGYEARQYVDSGMRWVAPGLAGPAIDVDAASFASASIDEAVADLLALIENSDPSVLITYDEHGTYGHPDHLRAHLVTRAAARASGVPMVEVASRSNDEGFAWFEFAEQRDTVTRALHCYPTQLSVDGDEIVHVGGQRQPIPLRIGLRLVPETLTERNTTARNGVDRDSSDTKTAE